MFKREGMSAYTNAENAVSYDILGEKIKFRSLTNNMVQKVVSDGKWFSFCTKIDDSQVNIMKIKNDKGFSVGSFISEYYENSGYRTSIYKYLLRNFLCYYEAPIVYKDRYTQNFKNSFSKYLITSNIHVVAAWLCISEEKAQMLYGNRLEGVDEDNECDLFPYVKLYVTKDHERKVTRPRKDIDLGISGTRIIPVYALKTGVDVLYSKLLEDTYDITFCKDSGQKRIINTTFNVDKIKEIYGKNADYISNAVDAWYDGEFLQNSAIERGYIRVFEMGASKYDNPLRSINYARILGYKKAEPDLAYVEIDLSSVLNTFKDCINLADKLDIDEVVESLELFNVGTSRKMGAIPIKSRQNLEDWAENQYTLLSTVFLRQLALFMIGNPQWFDNYTGEPKSVSSSAMLDDLDVADFDLDFSM